MHDDAEQKFCSAAQKSLTALPDVDMYCASAVEMSPELIDMQGFACLN
jgi:hypothetical protein